MRSRKHLILLTGALLLGTLVAGAKPPKPRPNPCQGFFEAPFVGFQGQIPDSEGKLCYWEDDPTLVHAKVEISPVATGRAYCIFLTDIEDLLGSNATTGHLIGADVDLDGEVFFEDDICINGCGDENLDKTWIIPAFLVGEDFTMPYCDAGVQNISPVYATGFDLPEESF